MKTQTMIAACTLLAACNYRVIDEYALIGDQLIVATGRDTLLCPIEVSDANPECEVLMPSSALFGGWFAGEKSMFLNGGTMASDTPECLATACRELVAFDLSTREQTVLGHPQSRRFMKSAGDWVVWIDARNDQNGLCRFPAGDEDCALDLYGIDLRSGAEHKLATTVSSTVGYDTFALDGSRLVYIDANSTLRAIDLETKSERVLSTAATRVRGGHAGVAWMEIIDASRSRLMHARLAETSTATTLGKFAADLNYEVDRDWVVYQTEEATIEAIAVESGKEQRLSAEGELAFGPVMRDGRVLWIDKQLSLLSLFDLRANTRADLVEVR